MDSVKKQIDEVVMKLAAGNISEAEAHIAIAEITTSMPEEDNLSDGVRAFMQDELAKMNLPEQDKQSLRESLEDKS